MLNTEFSQQTLDLFERLHWSQLDLPHLCFSDIEPVISRLTEHPLITSEQLGTSYLGVPVRCLSIGSGPTNILAWTQMHGDEATATAAVLDWLNILTAEVPDGLPADWGNLITLHIIPMLNPDGAALRSRFNAQGIDINRDAVALQTPEGRILADQVKRKKPAVAFNLHDQNPYYAVGETSMPATLAFLAPAFNEAKDVDGPRHRAKQIIAAMHEQLSEYLGGKMGRYDDTYSYRSFGDNIAKAGASTILIESGAHHNDPNRQLARKMNVLALHVALHTLLEKTYKSYALCDYYAIPENREDGICDIKIGALMTGDATFQCDIAINTDKRSGYSTVEAVGDLSNVAGFTNIDGHNACLKARKGYDLTTTLTLTESTYLDLLKQGYSFFYGEAALLNIETSLPVLICESAGSLQPWVRPGDPAFLLLYMDSLPYLAILDAEVILLN